MPLKLLATIRSAAIIGVVLACSSGAGARAQSLDSLVTHALGFAGQQLVRTVTEVADPHRFPRSTAANGTWSTKTSSDWTSGFFPGCLWFMDELGNDSRWLGWATSWTAALEAEKNDTSSHDVGFKIFCSFGNGYRLSPSPDYRDVIIQGAHSLATRYNATVGCTRSWNNWTFPVIIDNMMNLEILFWAARNGGDSAWYDMAMSHSLRTSVDHVRPDGGTYHLVDYDPNSGAVLTKATVQGYATESTWARGEAWGLHGFALAYRETRDARFLQTAEALADYFVAHLPADHVPYWDFQAPNIPNDEKDSSAAAIAASGLLDLCTLAPDATARTRYRAAAEAILSSLCSPAYLAEGTANRGILLHGVGNRPDHSEVDVALIYGDYYFLEALHRYRGITSDVAASTSVVRFVPGAANPSRGGAALDFELAGPAHVILRVFDARGAWVTSVVEGDFQAGVHAARWDGTSRNGTSVANGTYFCTLSTARQTMTRKVSLLR